MTLLLRIKTEYRTMSKANRRVADYLLSNPAEFLTLSALEIGNLSGSSAATVIRFSRQIGYKSLEELKIAVAQQQQEVEDGSELDSVIRADDSSEQLARKAVQLVTDTAQKLLHQLDYPTLDRALECVRSAGHVYLFGIGASGASANDLYLKLNRANIRATYTIDAHASIEFAVHMRATDVAIAFSYGGRTREVLLATEQAKKNGATVIAVTRNQPSPLSRLADIVLTVPDNEQLPRIGAIASRYSTMLIVDLLFLGAIQSALPNVEQNVLETASILFSLKEKEYKSGKG